MVGFGLMTAPLHEETVGQAGKDAVDGDGVGRAQAALVVAARGIEPGMETALDAPGRAVAVEPVHRVEAFGRQAGDQGDDFGLLSAYAFTSQQRGLGGEGKAYFLGSDGGALQRANFRAAFVAFAAAGEGGAFDAQLALGRGLGRGLRGLREKRRLAARAPGGGYCRGPWVGCL